jgi:hypothetical protein
MAIHQSDLDEQPVLPPEEVAKPTYAQIKHGALSLTNLNADQKVTYKQLYEEWKVRF